MNKTVFRILAVLVLVALLLAVFKLSNGFKTDIKTFYVKVDGTMVTERGSFKLNNNRFEVCNVVNKVTGEATEYTYKVVANTDVYRGRQKGFFCRHRGLDKPV